MRFCPFLYYRPLKKPFSPVRIVPAQDITVLPEGTIPGCSLEAVPRSLVSLADFAQLRCFSPRETALEII